MLNAVLLYYTNNQTTNIMKKSSNNIEIKGLKFGAAHSHQETINFVCDVYFNGKKVGAAENQGSGGGTWITPYAGTMELLKEAEKFIADQKIVYFEIQGEKYYQSLSDYVDVIVNDIFNKKEQDRVKKSLMNKTKNRIIVVNKKAFDAAEVVSYMEYKFNFDINEMINIKKSQQHIDVIKRTLNKITLKDGEIILNENIKHLVKAFTH